MHSVLLHARPPEARDSDGQNLKRIPQSDMLQMVKVFFTHKGLCPLSPSLQTGSQVERGEKEYRRGKWTERGLGEKKGKGSCRLCFDAAHLLICIYPVTLVINMPIR